VFVASPEPVLVAGLADEERALPDEVRGMCARVARPPQGQLQLLLLPNGRKVEAEAPKEDVLLDRNPRLGNFLDGHDHHFACRSSSLAR
jgi:hypothetical protein